MKKRFLLSLVIYVYPAVWWLGKLNKTIQMKTEISMVSKLGKY